MRSWGIVLAIIGASQFVLPRMGYEHVIFRVFRPYELYAAVGFIVAGVAMLGLSFRKKPAPKS